MLLVPPTPLQDSKVDLPSIHNTCSASTQDPSETLPLSWAKAARRNHQASPASARPPPPEAACVMQVCGLTLVRASRCIFLRVLGSARSCCQALGSLSTAFKTLQELTPVHPNPTAQVSPYVGFSPFKQEAFCADTQASCSSDLIFQLAVGRGCKEINVEGIVLLIAKQNKASPPPISVGFVLAHSL